MTIGTALLLIAGILILAAAFWMIWPQKAQRPGPENNWSRKAEDNYAVPLAVAIAIDNTDGCADGGSE